MKRRFSALMLSAGILASSAVSSSAAMGGGVWCYYTTDIRTYMSGAPITAYNIGGSTLIDAEILNWHYGFEVVWDGEARTLSITDLGNGFVSEQAKSGELCTSSSDKPGQVAGNYYATDIVTYVNGRTIEAYNIGGRTLIPAEELIYFGYNVIWNASDKTLKIERPDNMYTLDTEIGTLTSSSAYAEAGEVTLIGRGLAVTDDGGNMHIIEMPSGQLMAAAVGYGTYVRLSDIVSLLGGEMSLIGGAACINLVNKTPPYNYLPYSESSLVPKSETPCSTNPVISGLGLWVNRVPWDVKRMTAHGDTEFGHVFVCGGELWIPAYTGARLLGFAYGK